MSSRRHHNDMQNSFNFDRVSFNSTESEKRKEEGLTQASSSLSRKQLLELAREYARKIARRCGTVTSDDYFAAMLHDGLDPTQLGPAAGCVFRCPEFEFTGEWKKSQRVSNHASDLRVWRLREARFQPQLMPKKDIARAS